MECMNYFEPAEIGEALYSSAHVYWKLLLSSCGLSLSLSLWYYFFYLLDEADFDWNECNVNLN